MRIAIIQSSFNKEVTDGLLQGALQCLQENHVEFRSEDLFQAPGAFEIPLLAKKLAQSKRFNAIVCLGAVIKGETAHFEFISLACTLGLIQVNLSDLIPVTFGILTTYTEVQASERSRANAENKGREATLAALEQVRQLQKIASWAPSPQS